MEVASMDQPTAPPEVRTGRCSLILVIDGRRYRIRPAPPVAKGAKLWHVTVLSGQLRAGRTYSICTFKRMVDCTCPDATKNGAVCKHVRALQVLGLVAKTARPSALARWKASQEADRQPPKNAARARRRHKPAVPALPEDVAPVFPRIKPPYPTGLAASQADRADGFAIGSKCAVINEVETDPGLTFVDGFNCAVRNHVAALKGGAR
jgi:SWIM zinc finger